MAHGTRGRWIRAAATGLGVLLCSGLVGCWNADKPKENGLLKKAGLPGTPLLPGGGTGTGAMSKTGKTGQPTGTAGTGQFQPGTGATSGTPLGGGFGNSTNYPAQPGNPGAIGTPTQPGFVPPVGPPTYQPTGASGTPGASLGGASTGAGAYGGMSPPAPTLDTIQPPSPPVYPTGAGIDPAGGAQPLAPVGGPPASPGGFGK